MSKYVATYSSVLTEMQMVSLAVVLRHSLESYAAQGFDTQTAPADSHIGVLRDLYENVDAIRLGNRRGGHNPFDIAMKKVG